MILSAAVGFRALTRAPVELKRKQTGAQADWSVSVSLALSAKRELKRATGTVVLQSGRAQLERKRLACPECEARTKRATGTVALQSGALQRNSLQDSTI
jgi:hypothetical protein